MTKLFDYQDFAAKVKVKCPHMAEETLKEVTNCFFDSIVATWALHESPIVKMLVPFVPMAKAIVIKAEDKIDGQVD
jgi:hypothetical protein